MSDEHKGEQGSQNRPQRPMFDQEQQNARPPAVKKSNAPRQSASASGSRRTVRDPAATKKAQAGGEHSPRTLARMEQRRKKKKRRIRIAVISVLTVVVLLVAGAVALINWVAGEAIDKSEDFTGSAAAELKTEALPEYHGKGIVAGLVCGIDYNNETADGYITQDKVGNTDMILYVMFDTVNRKVNILQIPRDMYIGTEVNAGKYHKINGVYNAAEDPAQRMTALSKVIYDQLKLPVDFYIKLDLDAMKALVDHKGTIEVYVPQNIVDKKNPNNVLLEGWRHLTGDDVEFMVRNRNYPDGDVTRLRMQQSFYSALFREFKTLSAWDLVMWMRILLYYVDVGGLDIMEIGGLAQKALSVESANVVFVRPPYAGTHNTADGQDYIYLLPDETAEVLNEYFRPDGSEYSADELDIQTLPTADYGSAPAEVKTMGEIQSEEPAQPAA